MCLGCLLFTGCGYQFGRSGQLPPGMAVVHIPPIKNPTNETELSAILTNDLIGEFVKNGYAVTAAKDKSDGELIGGIGSVKTRTVSRVGDHTALERRVEITTAFKLRDSAGNVLWTANEITESEAYPISADEILTEDSRRAAISTLSKRLAEKIFNLLSDRFVE